MEKRWWQKEGRDLGQDVWSVGTTLESDQDFKRNDAIRLFRTFEGRDLLHSDSPQVEDDDDYDLDYNLSRSACETVQAEIAGRQKPVPKYQTSDADWATKRKAKYLEKAVVAYLGEPQEPYLNTWELMEEVFLDASIFGVGVAKVFSEEGKYKIERHFFHEMYTDPIESRYGRPKNLFHVYLIDRDRALYEFVEESDESEDVKAEMREAILSASRCDDQLSGLDRSTEIDMVSDQIKIVEAWRLQCSDVPGKHVISINNTLMYEEDWDRKNFPFVFVMWSPRRIGFGASGLVGQGMSMQREINENAVKLQERFRLCGNKRTYFESGSVDLEKMQANEAENLIEVAPGRQFPKEESVKPISESEFEWLRYNQENFYSTLGVSMMRASARKEPGVEAGVAIRTLNDMQTARFSIKAKRYENSYIQINNLIIQEMRENAVSGMKPKYDKEIGWKTLELPEDQFNISIAPASSLPNDPAGRMQMTNELFSSGVINVETYKQLLGWPDLEKEMNNQSSQSRWLEKTIDKMLDEEDFFEPPDGNIMDKPRALMQVSQSYFDALYDDAPEWATEKLRRYMMGLSEMIKKMQAEIAMAEAQIQQQLMAKEQSMAAPQQA